MRRGKSKGRGKSRQWTSMGCFRSLEECLQFIESNPHVRFDPNQPQPEVTGGVVRRSPKEVTPDKMGVKKIRFSCEFHNTYGCQAWWLVEDRSCGIVRRSVGLLDLDFELFSDGVMHNHSSYKGKQVDRTLKLRVEALADELYPRKIRRLLNEEGMEVSPIDPSSRISMHPSIDPVGLGCIHRSIESKSSRAESIRNRVEPKQFEIESSGNRVEPMHR